jgi:holo-[acyl-carrier protein] synthase
MVRLCQGIDLVERRKFARVFDGREVLFDAVFTQQEKRDCLMRKRPWEHFASHFAAKEAFLKALGLGFDPSGLPEVLREVEIVCAKKGAEIVVHGWIARLGRRRHIYRWSLSMGRGARFVVAAVVLAVAEVQGFGEKRESDPA